MKKIINIVLLLMMIYILSFNINAYAAKEDNNLFSSKILTDNTNKTDLSIHEPEYIPVKNIELNDFNEEMYVNDTQNLSAAIFPSTATNQTVSYSSSNSTVATVSQGGKLTAMGKGSCRIYVTCDNYKRSYELKVKVKTESIDVKSKYVIIKPNEKYNLKAKVLPADASQKLTFKSKNNSIAIVGTNGVITAKSVGNTSIIVENEDTTILVNVIVSTNADKIVPNNISNHNNEKSKSHIDNLTKKIKESNNNQIIVKGIDKVSSSALKELQGTDKTLIIELNDYSISIKGQDVFNANNEISTKFELSTTNNGIIVKLNESNKLPGTISISLKGESENYKYLYLLDKKTNTYHKLNSLSNNGFKINSTGKYLLSTEKIDNFKFNIIWLLGGIAAILILSIIYIFIKKKYWFW